MRFMENPIIQWFMENPTKMDEIHEKSYGSVI